MSLVFSYPWPPGMMFNHRYSVWNADEDELYETDKAVVLHAWAETGHTAARIIERRNLVIPYTNNFKREIVPGANESVSIPTMVLDTYKDSADAKLVAKHFGPSLCEGPFGKVLLAAMREPVLAEAKRLEEEANKK